MLFKHSLFYGKFFSPDGDGGGGSGANADDENADDTQNDSESNSDDTQKDSKNDDVAGLKSALEKERKTARAASKQLKALQDQIDELTNAGKTDEEKRDADLKAAQAKADAAEQRLRDANARSAVTDAATKANSVSVKAVYALIRDELDFDDDGEPTNVADLLAQAKKDEPQLFKASKGSADGGTETTTNREVKPGMDRLTHAYQNQSKTSARAR